MRSRALCVLCVHECAAASGEETEGVRGALRLCPWASATHRSVPVSTDDDGKSLRGKETNAWTSTSERQS